MHIPVARLVRFDSCLLIALAAFIPLFARTRDLGLSVGRAMPLLFIGMCTFIANDLDDIEKDRINHPERPLPNGDVKPSFAAGLYFVCLGLALFTTRFYVKTNVAFLYYLLLILSISYGYFVDHFSGLKSLYVAGATSVPIVIVAAFYPHEQRLYLVAGAVFACVLGRELCMDILDRAGDAESFIHRLDPSPLAVVAFSSQLIGLLLLTEQIHSIGDFVCFLLVTSLLVASGLCWFKLSWHRKAILLMKVQLFVGLCFLV